MASSSNRWLTDANPSIPIFYIDSLPHISFIFGNRKIRKRRFSYTIDVECSLAQLDWLYCFISSRILFIKRRKESACAARVWIKIRRSRTRRYRQDTCLSRVVLRTPRAKHVSVWSKTLGKNENTVSLISSRSRLISRPSKHNRIRISPYMFHAFIFIIFDLRLLQSNPRKRKYRHYMSDRILCHHRYFFSISRYTFMYSTLKSWTNRKIKDGSRWSRT